MTTQKPHHRDRLRRAAAFLLLAATPFAAARWHDAREPVAAGSWDVVYPLIWLIGAAPVALAARWLGWRRSLAWGALAALVLGLVLVVGVEWLPFFGVPALAVAAVLVPASTAGRGPRTPGRTSARRDGP